MDESRDVKSNGGRPSLKTADRIEILLNALERPMPLKRACEFAGIDDQTPVNWAKKDKGFSLRMAYAKAKGIGLAIDATMKKEPWKILKNIDSECFKDDPQTSVNITQIFTVRAGDKEIKLLR